MKNVARLKYVARRLLPGGFGCRPRRLAQVFPRGVLRRQARRAAPDNRAAGGLADAVASPDDGVCLRRRAGPDEIAARTGPSVPVRRAPPDDCTAPSRLVVVNRAAPNDGAAPD